MKKINLKLALLILFIFIVIGLVTKVITLGMSGVQFGQQGSKKSSIYKSTAGMVPAVFISFAIRLRIN